MAGRGKDPERLENLTEEELRELLTPRQIAFVEAYIQSGDATEAAIMAGYSRKTAASQGSRMLRNDKIAAYRRARIISLYDQAGVSPAWVGLRLVEIVERCMDGKPHLIWNSQTHAWEADGTWMFDAKNAVSALQTIGRSMGMFSDKNQSAGEDAGSGVVLLPPVMDNPDPPDGGTNDG